MKRRFMCLAALGLVIALARGPADGASAPAKKGVSVPGAERLTEYPSQYYLLYTDLPPDGAREASLRMSKMAEEYHERTKAFSGTINRKFPFLLFKEKNDYLKAGGMPGSAGVFSSAGGGRLMAIAGNGSRAWHVVQHEGFHQFYHAVIGGESRPWVNEGLAEYFGESLFTGDNYVSGILPPRRVAEIKKSISAGGFKPIRVMMEMSPSAWNAGLDHDNYNQAWAMVHFLAHGEEGRYQKAFTAFMLDLGRNKKWQQAWEANFGSTEGFEKRWAQWWLGLPDDPTPELYTRAHVATVAAYVARAQAQKQSFDNFDEFLRIADAGELKQSTEDWLPPTLISETIKAIQSRRNDTKWSLKQENQKSSEVTAVMKDQTRVMATINPQSKAARVTISIDDAVPTVARARALIADGKKERARALLQDVIRRLPKSPAIEDAKKALVEAK